MRFGPLCLLLAATGLAFGQEPAPATDKAAHTLMQNTLVQSERWLLEMFIQTGRDVPVSVLEEFQRLDGALQESYFRDLAQRSAMLLFVTREEVRLAEERRNAAENTRKMLLQSSADRRRERLRRAAITVFWSSLGTALAGFAGSYGCWYLSGHLDQRYLGSFSPREAALYKAWSELLQSFSYLSAGVGAAGVTVALPAFAAMSHR